MRNHDYPGSCHCGAIRYLYATAIEPPDWAIRECRCSFCRAHGAATTSDPAGTIEWIVDDPDLLQRYRFALATADFLVCRRCGAYAGAVVETPRGRFGIVNTRLLHPQPDDLPSAVAVSYDGEDADGRVARRELRWTPVTTVPW